MNNEKINLRVKIFAFFIILFVFVFIYFLGNENFVVKTVDSINSVINVVELKTFDARQKFSMNDRSPADNIIVVELDEKTYSAFTSQMGEWPVSRAVYADVLEYIEKDAPSVIGVDLMFINSDKYNKQNDLRLVDVLKKYENIFTSINFDDEDVKSRIPAKLPDYYKISVDNFSKINLMHNSSIVYANCRTLIPEIMNSKVNVGQINSLNDDDGTIRALYPFVIYNNEHYPHLSLAIALYLYEHQKLTEGMIVKIDENSNLHIADRKIPMNDSAGILLNWYPKNSFRTVSFLDVYNAAHGNDSLLSKDLFKNKIVYIGATATALYDIKSFPVSDSVPGVYLHSTFLNNIIDNNFIRKTHPATNCLICLCLSVFLIILGLKSQKQFVDISSFLLITVFYVIFSGWIMDKYNIWIPVIYPILSIVITFISIYVIKYTLKSRDFEYTYRLATTDGLTELYNHRFFQEQLAIQIENVKRYKNEFSLIILDIDFFKKFNDKYGHQAGDAVLRFVAQSIKKNVRSTDIVCRYGGEEMTIILPNTNKQDAIALAQKICDKIGTTDFRINATTTVNVTISLGVSTYPQDASSQNELIEVADSGLYLAKGNGRNQVGISKKE